MMSMTSTRFACSSASCWTTRPSVRPRGTRPRRTSPVAACASCAKPAPHSRREPVRMQASVDRTGGGRRDMVWLALMALALSVLIASAPSLHKRCGGWALIGVFAVSAAGACAAARLGGRAARPGALIVILAGGLARHADDGALSLQRHLPLYLGRARASRGHQ